MSGLVKQSGKVNVISRDRFENYQTSNEFRKVQQTCFRNAKLKKTSQTCYGLMDFLINRPKQSTTRRKVAASRIRRVIAIGRDHAFKKRGKQREGGRRKRYTRLKKSILRYRQKTDTEKHDLAEKKPDITAIGQVGRTTQGSASSFTAIHSRRFRQYCDNCTTPLLCSLTQTLLSNLNRFQKRAHERNEIKAHANRRFVLGFREVQNFMQIGKIKLLCIATDLEACAGEAGLDFTIAELKVQCNAKKIPYFFSLRRRQIAYAFYKKVPISCVGILDYDGVRDIVSELLEELSKARDGYKQMQLQKEADESQSQSDMSSLFEKKCVLI